MQRGVCGRHVFSLFCCRRFDGEEAWTLLSPLRGLMILRGLLSRGFTPRYQLLPLWGWLRFPAP